MIQSSFASLALAPAVLSALEAEGFASPFPVQARAIPAALSGADAVVLSLTGSGKTLAFVAPLLHRLGSRDARGAARANATRALVLVPTRELAAQVREVASRLAARLPGGLRIQAAFGGVSINLQMLALRGGADILVATPGRLLDLVDKNAVRLDSVRSLVLDEADRMLDMGFADEMGRILALLPRERQTLLFAATWDPLVQGLASAYLRAPALIDLRSPAAGTAAASAAEVRHLAEGVYLVPRDGKGPLLRRLMQEGGWRKVLVFTSSIRRADNVARKLEANGIQAAVLHADKSQGARTRALDDFRGGKTRVLVATDLASRGLDIEGLDCVINYELPRAALDYVHRTGRTSRAGQAGTVLSLVCPDEEAALRLVERQLGKSLARLGPIAD